MRLTRSNRLLQHFRDELPAAVKRRPGRTLLGVLFIGFLVALGIWVWPEMRRTVRMHRM